MLKLFSLVFFTLLNVQAAKANDQLHAKMKAMGSDLRQLRMQVASPELNDSSSQVCEHFVTLIKEASSITPDSIQALPPSERPAAIGHYQSLMASLADSVTALAAVFRKNDNASAAREIEKILAIRSDGHQIFAPDDQGVDLTFPSHGLIAHCQWVFGPSLTDQGILNVYWRKASDQSAAEPPKGFSVTIVMPDMPEMNNPPTEVSPLHNTDGSIAKGGFQISKMYFTMAGGWNVNLNLPGVTGAAKIETQTISVTVNAES